nr:D-glycero-beta-D-manno-heptose-7-phosphate kinase [bacterium]
GEHGMSLFESVPEVVRGQIEVTHIPTVAREVFDVTGAGDTVVAVSTLALAAGASMLDAARIANCAAGIVVSKVGTASVTTEELRKSLFRLP